MSTEEVDDKKPNVEDDENAEDPTGGKKMVLATRKLSVKPLKLVHILQNTKNYDAFSEDFKIRILAAWEDQFVGSHAKLLYCSDDDKNLVILNRAFSKVWTDRRPPPETKTSKDGKVKQEKIRGQDEESSSSDDDEEEGEKFVDAKQPAQEEEKPESFRVYQMFSGFTSQIPLFVGKKGIQRVETGDDNEDKSVPLIIDFHTHELIKNSIVEQIIVRINKSLKAELGGKFDSLVLGLRVQPCYGDRVRILSKTNVRYSEEMRRIAAAAKTIQKEIEDDAEEINKQRKEQQAEQDKKDRENLEKLKAKAKRDAMEDKKKQRGKGGKKRRAKTAAAASAKQVEEEEDEEEEEEEKVHKLIAEENAPLIDNRNERKVSKVEANADDPAYTLKEEEERLAKQLEELSLAPKNPEEEEEEKEEEK